MLQLAYAVLKHFFIFKNRVRFGHGYFCCNKNSSTPARLFLVLQKHSSAFRISHARCAGTLLPSAQKENKKTPLRAFFCFGGWGEIRTHGSLSTPLVFKTSALDLSATHPW